MGYHGILWGVNADASKSPCESINIQPVSQTARKSFWIAETPEEFAGRHASLGLRESSVLVLFISRFLRFAHVAVHHNAQNLWGGQPKNVVKRGSSGDNSESFPETLLHPWGKLSAAVIVAPWD
jgi:hypothetical protein